MTTVGVVLDPYATPPERQLAVARAADDAGLAELWLWEDCFQQSAVASAGAMLGATERLRVGLGVLPVPLRNVALTAMEVATLERAFPGRLVPGIGHGVQAWMEQVGARVASPLALLREYTTALRALLAGEHVTTHGRYVHLEDVTLGRPPLLAPPVLCAATGPRTVELVGQVADGVVLTGDHAPDDVRAVRAALVAARRAAGRGGEPLVVVDVPVVTGPDAHARLERARASGELSLPPGTGVAGDARAVADGLRRYVDAGADTVVLTASDDGTPDLDLVRFAGEEVAPLLA